MSSGLVAARPSYACTPSGTRSTVPSGLPPVTGPTGVVERSPFDPRDHDQNGAAVCLAVSARLASPMDVTMDVSLASGQQRQAGDTHGHCSRLGHGGA
jgi:hypothetical protein